MSVSKDAALSPRVCQPGGGDVYQVAAHDNRCILPAEATGGAFSLFELVVPPGDGVPLHMHTTEDETFIVTEGEIELTVGDAVHRLTPGSVAFGPRNTMHAFRNPGESEARMLLIASPGGLERFFSECNERLPRSKPFDPNLFVEIIRKHGMVVK